MARGAAPLVCLVLVSLLAACGGGEGSQQAFTPTAAEPGGSTQPAPVSEASTDLAWVELRAGDELTVASYYVVDRRNGATWRLDPGYLSGEEGAWLLGWLPDARAVVAYRGLLYAGAPTEKLTRFLPAFPIADNSVSWSPDGTMLAMQVYEGPSVQVQVVDVATQEGVKAFEDPGLQPQGWSPDGRRLAIRTGDRTTLVWDRLTDGLVELDTESVAWSNAGDRLAYARRVGQADAGMSAYEVAVRDLGTGEERVVTSLAATGVVLYPWSPDDELIPVGIGVESEKDGRRVDTFDLHMVEPATGSTRFIVRGAWEAVWGGDAMFFIGNVCGAFDLFSVDADGSGLRNYTDSMTWDEYPSVSQDGARIIFTAYERDASNRIRLLTTATGEVTDVAAGDAISLWQVPPEVIWSPDGTQVAFGVDLGHGACEAAVPQETTVEFSP